MKLKVPIALVFVCLLLQHCDEPNEKEENSLTSTTKQVHVDTASYAILPYDTSNQWIFKEVNVTSLSTTEIVKIEELLQTAISEYNVEQKKEYDSITKRHPEYDLKQHNFIIELTRYKRQCFPIINSKGEKEVWVNCFCNTWDENWRKSLVFVFDGGNCYFNLKINLTKQTFYELSVNGEA